MNTGTIRGSGNMLTDTVLKEGLTSEKRYSMGQ